MHIHISAMGAKAGGFLVRVGLLGMLLSPVPVMSADTALADSLADSLEAQGWRATKDDEGNTIYTREKPSVDNAKAGGNEALKQALEAKGWKVEWDADNNMILRPPANAATNDAEPATSASGPEAAPESNDTALADSLADSLEAQGWHARRDSHGNILYTRERPLPDVPRSHRNAALKTALEAKGWKVRWDADDNMILRPPMGQHASAPLVSAMAKTASPVTRIVPGMEYWNIERLPDGSLAFHPKTDSASDVSPPARLPGSCAASRYTADTAKLPVDSWRKAKSIGDAWLADAGIAETATSGRIRKVLRVYLVSIVTKRSPHRLLHQIAIRSADGSVIVLD